MTVLSPLARALAGLHAIGIVHGDVSPGNVLFDDTGRPVLADLGVSRLAGDDHAEVWGTDGFVAPEVTAGGAPGAASDVYALGALGWWCLSGGPPPPAVSGRTLRGEAGPGVPDALVEAIESCLSGRPDTRPSASDAALQIYDAAPAAPLRLAGSEDPAASLTHRIRDAARAEPAEAATGSRGRRRWLLRERADGAASAPRGTRTPARALAGGAQRAGGPRASGPGAGDPRASGPGAGGPGAGAFGEGARAETASRRRPVVLLAAAMAAALVGVVGWAAFGAGGGDEAGGEAARPVTAVAQASPGTRPPQSTAPSPGGSPASVRPGASGPSSPPPAAPTSSGSASTSSSSRPPADPSSAPAPGPLVDRSAAERRPAAVLDALNDLRTRFLTTGDAAVLADIDVPGSPAAASRAGELTAITARGATYRGVQMTVSGARVVAASADRVRVRARVATSDYAIVDRTGQVEQRAADPGEPLDYVLAWNQGRWRLAEVTPPAGG